MKTPNTTNSIPKQIWFIILIALLRCSSAPAADVTLTANPFGELVVKRLGATGNLDPNGKVIATFGDFLNLHSAQIFSDGCCNVISTLYVNDLFVQRTHDWDGRTIIVGPAPPNATAAGASTNYSVMQLGGEDPRIARALTEISAIRSELKAKDSEIAALRQAVTELKKSVGQLTPPTKSQALN